MPTNQVSIHTPTQGVTLRKYVGDQLIQVSIHTPTQGVTAITAYFTLTKSVSIHTPTQGVTIAGYCRDIDKGFQSTHPRRV